MSNLDSWRGKWALVTGASSGIGWTLAEELAARGTHLVVTARRKQRLTKLRREWRSTYGVQTEELAADLAELSAPQEVWAHRDHEGAMRWKLLGIIPIMTASGTETTRSAAGRVMAESVWLPSSLCRDDVAWTSRHVSSLSHTW
jgi:NAD(P)-dependent dehydrogenase (short-subunit alcohol dehydrogenase family)